MAPSFHKLVKVGNVLIHFLAINAPNTTAYPWLTLISTHHLMVTSRSSVRLIHYWFCRHIYSL